MIGLLFMGSSNVRADNGNPFGFETQTHPLQYEYCKKTEAEYGGREPFLYECRSAPRVHPDIERISLKFVEDVGLCFIRAASPDYALFDKRLKDLIDGFKDQIVKKYGPPTSELKEVDPQFLVTEKEYRLITGDEKYRYDWEQKSGFSGLGDVARISVERGFQSGRAFIFFELKTSEACQKKEDELRFHAF